jgi:hypothetical protein
MEQSGCICSLLCAGDRDKWKGVEPEPEPDAQGFSRCSF